MKIFLTGATGYIGNNIARELASQGHCIHVLIRNPEASVDLDHPNIRVFKGDVTNINSIIPAIKNCEQVYHTAALTKMQAYNRSKFYSINTSGTGNVLEAAFNEGVKKLVFTSSGAVLGPSLNHPIQEDDPRITSFDNDYELSKMLAENLVIDYARRGLHTTIVSPTRVYGPGPDTYSNAINRFVKKFIDKGFAFIPIGLTAIGNYTFVNDVVKGHLLAMEHSRSGEKYILGGENISFNYFFETVRYLSGNNGKYLHLPKSLMKSVACFKEYIDKLLKRDTELTTDMIDRFYINRALSSQKACAELGYTITPFVDGMEQTIQSIKQSISCKTISMS